MTSFYFVGNIFAEKRGVSKCQVRDQQAHGPRRSWLSSRKRDDSFCRTLGGSLVAQMIKILPAMQVTEIWSLGWEDPLEKGMTIHSNIFVWKVLGWGAWWATVHGVAKSQTGLSNYPFHFWKVLKVFWREKKSIHFRLKQKNTTVFLLHNTF